MAADDHCEQLLAGAFFGDDHTRQSMAQELRSRLRQGLPLRVYLGVDPTAPDLHIGHAVPMRKLAQFQRLDHDCTFLIGDFTARIGDPTGRDRSRPPLTSDDIDGNVDTFARQAFKILDPDRTRIEYNSRWLSRLTFEDVTRLAGHFTVAQFLERDNFGRRYDEGRPIHLSELFYGLMQGYDAYAMQTDVQIGGADQTFNILAGRHLQTALGQPPQVMLTMPILPGTDGKIKMSKSLGNAIPMTASPEDMYGQIMSLPDEAMPIYFRLLTSHEPLEVDRMVADYHPRDLKMRLAREITSQFHSAEDAAGAETAFVRVFQHHDLPEEIPEHRIGSGRRILDVLVDLGLVASRNEARRLIVQGAVRLDGRTVTDPDTPIVIGDASPVLRAGKRRFVRLVGS